MVFLYIYPRLLSDLRLLLCMFNAYPSTKAGISDFDPQPQRPYRKYVDPSIKSPKWIKLDPYKNGRGEIIKYHLCDDITGWNFTDGCPRAWSLDVRENFSKFLNLTNLLALQKRLKLAPSIPDRMVRNLPLVFPLYCLNSIRSYCVIIYVGHFWPPNLYPIPDLYARIPGFYVEIPAFYSTIFIFVFRCASNVGVQVLVEFLCYVSNDSARVMRRQGGRSGSCWWWKILCKCARKIILARHLLHQAESRSRDSVRILVLQGNG